MVRRTISIVRRLRRCRCRNQSRRTGPTTNSTRTRSAPNRTGCKSIHSPINRTISGSMFLSPPLSHASPPCTAPNEMLSRVQGGEKEEGWGHSSDATLAERMSSAWKRSLSCSITSGVSFSCSMRMRRSFSICCISSSSCSSEGSDFNLSSFSLGREQVEYRTAYSIPRLLPPINFTVYTIAYFLPICQYTPLYCCLP